MNLTTKAAQLNFKDLSLSSTSMVNPTGDFFSKFILDGVDTYIENVHTKMMLLTYKNEVIPITVNDEEYENSFVCSPYSHYVSYANIIVDRIKNPVFKKLFISLLKVYGNVMKKGEINKVVIVNNWLFTTNPPPQLDKNALKEILEYLISMFPNHAILFRSITKETSPDFFNALKELKFDLLASRFVFITQTKDEKIFQTRIFKSDMRLLNDSKYTLVPANELSEAELSHMIELYQALYIQKYSKLNPQFNVRFIKLAMEFGILHFKALKIEDQIEGVFGYFYQNGIMISPFFGYDPAKIEKTGLYRILSTLLLLEARNHQALFNQSAGGAFFKKIRRAQGHLEYTAVFSRHLPWKRRVPWHILKGIMNTLGIIFMKRY
jgi:hypothetical protein